MRHGEQVRRRSVDAHGAHLGRVLGAELEADWSPLIAFFMVVATLAVGVLPTWQPAWPAWLAWTVALVAAVLFFASVLARELAHALAARAFGIRRRRITLFLFGGMAHMNEESTSPMAELPTALAGPGHQRSHRCRCPRRRGRGVHGPRLGPPPVAPIGQPPDRGVRHGARLAPRRRPGLQGHPLVGDLGHSSRHAVVRAWPIAAVASVVTPTDEVHVLGADAVEKDALSALVRHGLHEIPVDDGGRLLGIVGRQDIARWVAAGRAA